MWGLLKLKEKYSEKAECYICSSAGTLVLWRITVYFAYGQEEQVALGARRSQCQFWRLMEVEGGITSLNGSQFSRKHKLLIPN